MSIIPKITNETVTKQIAVWFNINKCLIWESYLVDLEDLAEYLRNNEKNTTEESSDSAYNDPANWISVENKGGEKRRVITNFLQLSEDEIVQHLDGDEAPWNLEFLRRNLLKLARNIEVSFITIIEVEINEGFETAIQKAEVTKSFTGQSLW